jgi:hypothetical protein
MCELFTSENCPAVRKIIGEGYAIPFLFIDTSVVMQSDPSKKYSIHCALKNGPIPCSETGAIVYRIEVDGLKGYAVNFPIDDGSMF